MERCPVCRARLRGASLCPRCGADLGAAIAAMTRANRACGEAVLALARGEPARARLAAARAHALHHTPLSRTLIDLTTQLLDHPRNRGLPRINRPRSPASNRFSPLRPR